MRTASPFLPSSKAAKELSMSHSHEIAEQLRVAQDALARRERQIDAMHRISEALFLHLDSDS